MELEAVVRLGDLLGPEAAARLRDKLEREERAAAKKKRDRELSRKRHLGRTIRYKREDGE